MLVVSGTKLAEEIGASGSEVWRLVQQLRSLGVQIAGHPGTGYTLESVPDLLLPEALDPLVAGTIFAGRLHHFFCAGSTNAAAMQAAQNGEAEGAVFVAEEQTAGRGRSGHTWYSAGGLGIYLSVILRPRMGPADALALSLMAGLAAAAAVEKVTGARPDLRWPNDLLLARAFRTEAGVRLEERKFCGILTELNAELTRVRYVVVGMGMNVNHESFPPELESLATSLRLETGRTWSRVELAGALLQSLDREYRRLHRAEEDDDAQACTDLFRRFQEQSSYARGRRVRVEERGGYTGTTAGLDARGFLLVRTDDDNGSIRTVLAGGVRACP